MRCPRSAGCAAASPLRRSARGAHRRRHTRPVPDIADPAAPWLVGLIACPTALEAAAVREALTERGLRTRSVPSGRAKLAWTCVAGGSTLALVVSGRGAWGARQGASLWMPPSRRGGSPGGGPPPPPVAAPSQPHPGG